MTEDKIEYMEGKRKCRWMLILIGTVILCACGKEDSSGTPDADISRELVLKDKDEIDETAAQWDRGYNLPVENSEREEAEADCRAVMEMVSEIYRLADKGKTSNVIISEEVMLRMKAVIKGTGRPVTSAERYSVMENYQQMERFLLDSEQGNNGTVILYEINWDGGIGRLKYTYDGTDMYVLSVRAVWTDNGRSMALYAFYGRMKKWSYTERGWFCYDLCVPQPPEVSEVVDGGRMVRVKPLTDECRELSKKCVLPLGYQGNNLLCSNWDRDNLEDLDYNGMYEYLYEMKYGKRFDSECYPDGIPAEEFERVITDYLPVTAIQLREWAVFDEEHQTYEWAQLGCMNYTLTYFGTSLPEVVHVKKNADGTVIMTVEAVCDMIVCDDAVITHELAVCFSEDGSFRYLGNKILNNGIWNLPKYQYRLGNR